MAGAMDVLRDEHRVILRGLVALGSAADRVARGDRIPDGWWDRLIRLLQAFADRNHHAKEERYLFPALGKAGVPADGGPVAVMLAEHVDGRQCLESMRAAEPWRRLEAARLYIRLLRDHIDKENGVLFPLAEAVLDGRAMDALAREFASVEMEQGRDATMDHAEAELDALESALR